MLLVLAATLCIAVPTAAQDETPPSGTLKLYAPTTDAFPTLRMNFEAFNADGSFVDGVRAADLTVLEDGVTLPVRLVERMEPGLQLVMAFNLAPALAQVNQNVTQFDRTRQALAAWAHNRATAGYDDLSLVANTGLSLIRSTNASRWAAELDVYAPELAKEQPGLESLSRALELAIDPNPRPLMKRAILYVTPPPTTTAIAGLANLSDQAAQTGARVFVWMLSPGPGTLPEGVAVLQSLATRTGGRFIELKPGDEPPDLESWLAPLRPVYEAQYDSKIVASGEHVLALQLAQKTGEPLASLEQPFELTVLSPNPILLSPPVEVNREWVRRDREWTLTPGQMTLGALVEFPDTFPRSLRASRLLVNGVLAAENRAAPFDRFTIDLTPYEVSQTLMVHIEVDDELGLSGRSMDFPVSLVVLPKPGVLPFGRITESGLIAIGALGVAGLVLLGVLIGDRRSRAWKKSKVERKRMEDPLTQPVLESPPAVRPARTQPRTAPAAAPARLVRLGLENEPVSSRPVPLDGKEMLLGSDPRLVNCLVEDESVSGVHARIFVARGQRYLVCDAGSVAGTWVNYAPVSTDGVTLEHGDTLSLGRVTLRFELASPPRRPAPRVETTPLPAGVETGARPVLDLSAAVGVAPENTGDAL